MSAPRLFVMLVLLMHGIASGASGTEADPFTTISEVRNLPIPEAGKGLHFVLDAQILHIGLARSGLFLAQDHMGIYAAVLREIDKGLPFQQGSVVRIRGRTNRGSYLPILEIEHLEVLANEPLPEALPLTYDNIFHPELDCSWVSLEGFVLGSSLNSSYLTLQVETFGSLIDVILENRPDSDEKARHLIHRHIKLQGIAASQANEKRQLTARNIRVQDFSDIDLTVSSGQIPLVGIDKLLTPQWSSVGKVRIRGVVTNVQNQRFYIRGIGGSLLAKVRGTVEAGVGDIVEVLGTVSVEPFSPMLYVEQVTVLEGRGSAGPLPFDPSTDTFTSALNNELISTTGQLISITNTENSEQTVLQCQSGDTTFSVFLPAGSDITFEPGTQLRITGICQLVSEASRPDVSTIEGFRIVSGSVGDVEMLTPQSWLTLRRVLIGFAAAVAATLLALIWAISLRKRVAHQTRVMRGQVEREAMLGERHRIARELHDTVEQNMAGLSMQLDNVSQAIEKGDPSTGTRALKIADTMLHACRTQARDSVVELRTTFQKGASVADYIDDSVLETVAKYGITFSRETSGIVFHIGQFRARHLLRAIQEAILNAAKHGSPENIKFSAAYSHHGLTATVTDDGSGFDATASPPPGHFGLIGMRERCERIGATLSVESAPGATKLTFKLPREAPEEKAPTI